jgi:peptidoglycan/xylan/chitin deacetylase (PgdA/CDA1 family)
MKKIILTFLIAVLIIAALGFTWNPRHAKTITLTNKTIKEKETAATNLNDYLKITPNQDYEIHIVKVPILMYHDVAPWPAFSTNLTRSLTVQPEEFDKEMDYLYMNGYTPITLKELNLIWQRQEVMPPKPIVLTFDDGDYGVYKYAYPVLEKYKFKSILFLITKYVKYHTHFYMQRYEIEEMMKSGLFEIGSHTVDHVNLARISPEKALFELQQSKEDIKNYLNYDATSFCYPSGGFDSQVLEYVQECGYTMATTELPGTANQNQDHLLLRRIRIDGRENISIFIAKIKRY